MSEKDETHHRHEILVAGVIGVRAKIVRGTPKALFDGVYVFELCHFRGAFRQRNYWSRRESCLYRVSWQRSTFFESGFEMLNNRLGCVHRVLRATRGA